MAQAYQNADGLQQPFPNYWNDKKNFFNKPRAVNTFGPIKVLQIDYDLSLLPAGAVNYPADLNNDGTADGFSDEDTGLPALSSVLRVICIPSVAAAGGTSIALGTFQKTGAAVAATGLITATEGAIANWDTAGARTYGNGALVATAAETASVGANPVFLAFTTVGTYTAGKGRIFIEYIDSADPLIQAPA